MPTIPIDKILGGERLPESKRIPIGKILGNGVVGEDSFRRIPIDKIVNPRDLNNPEALSNWANQNPGARLTVDEEDAVLSLRSEKDLELDKIAKAVPGALAEAGVDVGYGVWDLIKLSLTRAVSLDGMDRAIADSRIGLAALEGAGRGGTDLAMLGGEAGLHASLRKSKPEDDRNVSNSLLAGGHSLVDRSMKGPRDDDGRLIPETISRATIGYKDFTEEEKEVVRQKYRNLRAVTSRRNEYYEGDETFLGDMSTLLLSESTSPHMVNAIRALVPPKLAELGSMVLGPEGGAVAVAKGASVAAAKKVTKKAAAKAAVDATETVADAAEKVKDFTEPFDEASNALGLGSGNMISRAAESIENRMRAASAYLDGIRRHVGEGPQDVNMFVRMSYDPALSPLQRSVSRYLGAGVQSGIPFISKSLKLLSTPARVVTQSLGSAAEAGAVGGLIALPTFNEETIGGGIGAAAALAFAGTGGGETLFGNQRRVDAAANNFVQRLPKEHQEILKDRGFTNDQLARMATWERWVTGLNKGSNGDPNVDFIYTDAKSFTDVMEMLEEHGVNKVNPVEDTQSDYQKIVEAAGLSQIVSPTKGVQILHTRTPGSNPIVLINLDKMSSTTVTHESIHALQRLDAFQGYFQQIHGVLFDQPSRVKGEEGTKGIVSDQDLDFAYESYMDRVSQSEGPEVARALRQHDTDMADRYGARNPNAVEAEASYWRRTRIKSEIEADMFESLMTSRDPLYLNKRDLKELPSQLKTPFAQMATLVARFLAGTSPTESLSVQGYKAKGKDINYENPELVAEVNSLINFQNKIHLSEDGKSIQKPTAQGDFGGASYRPSQIKKGSALAKQMEGSLLVRTDDKGQTMFDADGNLELVRSASELRVKEKERAKVLNRAFTDQQYSADSDAPGKHPVNFDSEATDARSQVTGDYIADAAMQKLRNTPGMPQGVINALDVLNGAMKNGNVVELDYNARLIPKGRTRSQYSSAIGSTLRLAIPFSIYLTKAGNMIINTVDLTHLDAKYDRVLRDPERSERITKLWGGGDKEANRQAFDKSLVQYIENTVNPGKEGLAKGLHSSPEVARDMANVLSAFMGFKKKDINFVNNRERQLAILEEMNPNRDDNLIRSRRLDAINSVRSTDLPRMPLSRRGYSDIQRNRDVGEPRFDPAPGDGLEARIRALDVGDKNRKQIGLTNADYPTNPNPKSVALVPRMGVVNKKVSKAIGMPRSYGEVAQIVSTQVNRMLKLADKDPEFAKRSGSFYWDMGNTALQLGETLSPVNRSKWDTADLMLRFLSLGSPRSSVPSNSTKSGRSIGAPLGAPAGYKIGMGTAQRGAYLASKAWEQGNHFDVSSKAAIGADDKVRNFYLNSMAELIDMARAEGDVAGVNLLMNRVAQTLDFVKKGQPVDAATQAKLKTFLDGAATIDMWDMASKGYAHPGFVPGEKKPFHWTVPRDRVKTKMKGRGWMKALAAIEVPYVDKKGENKKFTPNSPMELDYQIARSFMIDGKSDWTEAEWELRKGEGFSEDTEWSYFREKNDSGLTPGGGGPVYDAQQFIDGNIADEINRLGKAHLFGKEKLMARNAQEIMWSGAKVDNPDLTNRILYLFGDRLGEAAKHLSRIKSGYFGTRQEHIGPKQPIHALADTIMSALDDTYNKAADQTIPIEVTSMGKSRDAKAVQDLESDIGVQRMTELVADGLGPQLQHGLDSLGIDVVVNIVKNGLGGFTEKGVVGVNPNIVVDLRGQPELTLVIMKALSVAWDQDGGNLIRPRTVEEALSGNRYNKAIQFDTTRLTAKQTGDFFGELSKLKDENGEIFLTGFTETPKGMIIGDQFYEGDMVKARAENFKEIKAIRDKYSIPEEAINDVVIETFYRPEKESEKSEVFKSHPELARTVAKIARQRIKEARGRAKDSQPGAVDYQLDNQKRGEKFISNYDSFTGKSQRDDLKTKIGEPVGIESMLGTKSSKEADAIKKGFDAEIAKKPIVPKLSKKKKIAKVNDIRFDQNLRDKRTRAFRTGATKTEVEAYKTAKKRARVKERAAAKKVRDKAKAAAKKKGTK